MPFRLLSLLFALALATPAAHAQFGVGGIIGDPTGVTAKIGAGRGALTLDVNIDDAVYGQLHYLLREQRLRGAGADVRFLVGPGVLVGEGGDDPVVALSALFGLNWYIDPQFEVFGQLTPRLFVTPFTEGDVEAAFGLRFYP